MKFFVIDRGDSSVGIDSIEEQVTVNVVGKKHFNDDFYDEFETNMKEFLIGQYEQSTIVEVYTENELNELYSNYTGETYD